MRGSFKNASLSRVLGLENLVKFFQRTTLCFDKEEVNNDELEDIPENEEYVARSNELAHELMSPGLISPRRADLQPIADIAERNGSGKGVDESGASSNHL
jgi:hypothetical protein